MQWQPIETAPKGIPETRIHPKTKRPYDVISPARIIATNGTFVCESYWIDEKQGRWHKFATGENVTHWMPLPEPPKC